MLFTTPESLQNAALRDALRSANQSGSIGCVAIDEAHCVSSWGHDFRPAYRRIGNLRPMLPGVPFLALTATATRSVAADISSVLQLSIKPYVNHDSSLPKRVPNTIVASGRSMTTCHASTGRSCGTTYYRYGPVWRLSINRPELALCCIHLPKPRRPDFIVRNAWQPFSGGPLGSNDR